MMDKSDQFDRIASYYDGFAGKLLSEYVYGNVRLQAAISHALRWIPSQAGKILDVGFGLGWSTHEIKRHFPDSEVVGIDVSPRLAGLARQLFGSLGIAFVVGDVAAKDAPSAGEGYHAIVMLDVYEHVSKSNREAVHRFLGRSLRHDGTLVLSFPSVLHQENLRAHHPAAMQPVDEDVTLEDIGRLAGDVGAEVLHYSCQSLGHAHDYVHAVLRREPRFRRQRPVPRPVEMEGPDRRRRRVAQRLEVEVLHNGSILSKGRGPGICIAAPQLPGVTETFIEAHIRRLPADIKLLHGGWVPLFCDGEPLLRGSLFARLLRGAMSRAFPVPEGYFERRALGRVLKRHGARAVVAEYGPVGVGMLEPCRRAGVPLVVHFHGADAYARKFVEGSGGDYSPLFAQAAAIVAVSRDMLEQLRRLGAPEDKLHYNPYGVDVDAFAGSDPAGSRPVFLATGRFVDKKAPFLTLLAFEKVTERFPDSRLIMIGDGPLREACQQMSRALGLCDRIRFPGAVPHSEVADAMRRARAFVQHSLRPGNGDSEGTPVAVLEAGASGLPVVATRHGGITDVVIDGDTGFLVAEGDVDDMAQRMSALAEDPDLAARMGRAARERICAEYSIDRSIGRLWSIVSGVMA